MTTIRLLRDPPLDGPTNMARDEALMLRVGSGASPAAMRLYQWSPPTISLGYFQRYADYEALSPPAGRLPVVRRPTGGGAILHDLELTYSLALPVGHPLLAQGPNRLYQLARDAIVEALNKIGSNAVRCGHIDDSGAARGPFFCFERRHCYDVLVGTEKIAGSAQRRTRHAVLQHGSIILGNRFPQQRAAHPQQPFEESIAALRESMVASLEAITGCRIVPGPWSLEEVAEATRSLAKYASPAWTGRL
jgi:lipoate-protein ligase A